MPYIKRFNIKTFPQWDWERIIRVASSGFVDKNDPLFSAYDYINAIANNSQPVGNKEVVLVSFGKSVLNEIEILEWAENNKLCLASPREVFLIPASFPNWFRTLGYESHTADPGQEKSSYFGEKALFEQHA